MLTVTNIILAGGKGTRMGSADCHKVCFEIDGRPAIVRAIDTYRTCGIQQQVVVVGALAGQVIEMVGRAHEGVAFAYQAEQAGTGDAARQGARLLAGLRYEGAVLLAAGDRLVDPQVIEQLIALFERSDSDLVFISGPRAEAQQGRIVRAADGSVLGIVEHADLSARRALGEVRGLALAALDARATHATPAGARGPAAQARRVLASAFGDAKKAERAFGEVWTRLAAWEDLTAEALLALIPPERCTFDLAGGCEAPLTPDEVDAGREVNFSIYLLRAPALYWALAHLNTDNAQGEEYLSDIVNLLAQARLGGRPRYRVQALTIDDRNLVLGYNTPAELLEVEAVVRARRERQVVLEPGASRAYRPVSEWQALFARLRQGAAGPADPADQADRAEPADRAVSALQDELTGIYGRQAGLIDERLAAYAALLDECARTLGPHRPVVLARAPGRINIMGRHIDHQGGNCNLMAIDREVLLAAARREDDQINLYNVEHERFGDRHFSMGQLLSELTWDDWRSLVNSDVVRRMVVQSAGDWAQYVRAALLRLQKHYRHVQLRGVDLVIHGTIPVAAGLSSSSALVVATAEAVVALHGLDVRPRQFVDLCGEGEWFVGTRGGAADHAAMKFAQREAVINVHFFPFGVGEAAPFPPGYRLVFCHSGRKAEKAAGSRETFNRRIACYHLGVSLTRQMYPQYATLIEHLRDISPRTLPLRLSEIYRLLLKLPEHVSGRELLDLLPPETLEPLVGNCAEDQTDYPIRGVTLFGLAECERGRLFPTYLRNGEMAEAGRLMRVSHDGDRVVSHDDNWRVQEYAPRTGNRHLLDLMDGLESGEPERVLAAQLHLQAGGYGCSTPEIDLIVDVALRTPGVQGAQLAGAGLGGGAMILAREESLPELRQRLAEIYYQPRGLEPAVLACTPIGGSSVLAMNGG